jgi:predicted amidohydrolase YtcJ
MVVLDRDIFKLPPPEITSAKVAATIVGGEVVYRRNEESGTGD